VASATLAPSYTYTSITSSVYICIALYDRHIEGYTLNYITIRTNGGSPCM